MDIKNSKEKYSETVGIKDFEKAREPFFSTKSTEERAGMGFTVMESFMDIVELKKNEHSGVIVRMEKKLGEGCEAVVGG